MSNAIEPEFAVEQYLTDRSYELTESSVRNQRYRLQRFLDWAADDGQLDDMRNLNERRIHEFKLHRQQQDLSPNTVRNHLYTFKKFLEFCESQGYVRQGLADRLNIPMVNKHDQAKDVHIDEDRAQEIIEYLTEFEWASRLHVTFHLLWHTGMRSGSLRALDVEDWFPEANPPFLRVRHRPETETPLKLQVEGERDIAIRDDELASALVDYIERVRPDVVDEHGREPLLATQYGRASSGTIQSAIYRATSPCLTEGHCTIDGEGPISACEYTNLAEA